MENSNSILGGVSPLKARQSSRGGKRAGQATATSKRRGGFAKSKGARGAGGRNVGGYNVATSFTPGAAWKAPPSGGTIKPTKPFGWTPTGDIEVDDPKGWKKWHPETEGTPDREEKRKSKGSFKEVWAANEDNFQDKWKDKGGYEAWKKQAQKEIDEGYYDKKFMKGTKGKPGYWQYFGPDGNEISESEFAKYDPGSKTSF